MTSTLQVLGALIVFGSVAVGLYIKVSGGQWQRITKADRVAIAFTAAGAVVTLASFTAQRRQTAENGVREAAREAESKSQRDRERRGQAPLTNLMLEWTFEDVPPTLWAGAANAPAVPACTSEFFQHRNEPRHTLVYPFLASLASGNWNRQPMLLLLSFDESASLVLPLGMLDLDPAAGEWIRTPARRLKDVAATVDYAQDLDECLDVHVQPAPEPATPRMRRCPVDVRLERADPRATLRWTLGPDCISSGIDRAESSSPPKAALPDRISMLLLTNVEDLPFDPGNFARAGRLLPWFSEKRPETKLFQSRSRLRLVTNESRGDRADYALQFHVSERFVGGVDTISYSYPLITRWSGSRQR